MVNLPELRDRMKSVERLPEVPQRPDAKPDFTRSTMDRAVERLYQTVGREMLSNHGHTVNERPQPGAPDVPGASRRMFGRRAEETKLPSIFGLCLTSLLIAALAGTGIFSLTHSSKDKAIAESTPPEEMPEKAREGTGSITVPAVRPPATDVVQSAAMAQPAPSAASAQVVPEPEAKSANGSPRPAALPPDDPAPNTMPTRAGPVPGVASTAEVSGLATPYSKPELDTATTPAAPTSGATATAATARSSSPPSEWRLSPTQSAALVARGDASLATGDVTSARLLYEYAAGSGEARAAVRLAETFDPLFLARARLRGVSGDLTVALFWYRRARDLGATEVERVLEALETKAGG